ncbi:MAG TPA: hypothetical protein PKB10_14925 [Tepidisphaeraceae bacterium]|nr:hypothetical protein [Tepidisphaeraceae bacterium]
MSATSPISCAALVRDLMFSSKITAAARQIGVSVMVVRDPSRLAEVGGSRLFVDLDHPGFIDAARSWRDRTGGELIGFASHVNTPAIDQAREAGFDRVLSRGAFDRQVIELLKT